MLAHMLPDMHERFLIRPVFGIEHFGRTFDELSERRAGHTLAQLRVPREFDDVDALVPKIGFRAVDPDNPVRHSPPQNTNRLDPIAAAGGLKRLSITSVNPEEYFVKPTDTPCLPGVA